uniref:CASP-like protein n=1 Tax=Ananas comosus var. bracteatus TaxID=296719 RepID=A0A6V7NZ68_ANACO|nr:unnamed protein product [Ananas comosus var. bracteatus]
MFLKSEATSILRSIKNGTLGQSGCRRELSLHGFPGTVTAPGRGGGERDVVAGAGAGAGAAGWGFAPPPNPRFGRRRRGIAYEVDAPGFSGGSGGIAAPLRGEADHLAGAAEGLLGEADVPGVERRVCWIPAPIVPPPRGEVGRLPAAAAAGLLGEADVPGVERRSRRVPAPGRGEADPLSAAAAPGFSEKPMSPARRHEAVGSPLRLAEKPFPSPPRNTPEKPGSPEAAAPPLAAAALTIASRLAREDRAMIAKVVAGTIVDGDGGAGAGGGGGGGGGGGSEREGERGIWGVPGSVRKAEVRRAAVGLRVSAAVLCLISFSTMASDKTQGWAGDSFDRYEEYRYSLAVNVIAFAYSGFQVFAELHRVITGRYIIRRRSSCYLDLTMDQILAYLLISSSSAAASRNDVWVTRFGGDDFTKMVNVSVAMSFLAFFAVALSSVISAYNLFSWNL